MSQKTTLYIVLIVLLALVVVRHNSKGSPTVNPEPDPKPIVVVPENPVIPKLETNIIYDDFDKAVRLAKLHQRYIIVVFGADWCPYCEVLKKDAQKIQELSKYIVCFLDTDNRDKNQSVINIFKPKSLPTSLFLDTTNKVLSRKIGYRPKDYTQWLNSLDSYVQ